MKTVGLVPVNALDIAKSRLRGILDEDERRALVAWLAGRVVGALSAADVLDAIALLSPDAQLLASFSQAGGVVPLRSHGRGLNADLAQGRRWAMARGAEALLVVLGDLPLLTPGAVRALWHVAQADQARSTVVLAPDRAQQGTNALLLRPPGTIPFAFGQRSLGAHLALARRAGIAPRCVVSDETSFDVDMPADVAELRERGLWTPRDAWQASGTEGARHEVS